MPNMYLLFSHTLTKEQINDAKKNYNVKQFIKLPNNLQKIWSDVNPFQIEKKLLHEVEIFLSENAKPADYILIQGEWGFTYSMVNFSMRQGYIPIYSATKREYSQKIIDDKIVNEHIFHHVRFKKYKEFVD